MDKNLFPQYSNCLLCPRKCDVDRNANQLGYCLSNASLNIASICLHMGEEPAISGNHGVCNVFFSHCNLQCSYCQNLQISNNAGTAKSKYNNIMDVVECITAFLKQGCKTIGFVSPTHFSPHVIAIIEELRKQQQHPTIAYNTNGYENAETIAALAEYVDIYLPDLKYNDSHTAASFSEAANYPEISKAAIKEMFRQKGATLRMDDDVSAASGLIVRHLVLPGHADESIQLLEWLADECSPRIHLSLMSQYTPTLNVKNHPSLGRQLEASEYEKVTNTAIQLGFIYGWTQELSSQHYYLPDFDKENPFEN